MFDPSKPDWFRLNGPSAAFDTRIHAVRPDLADVELASRVLAPRYARGVVRSCTAPQVLIRAAASEFEPAVSELLLGEAFALLDASGRWGWGYSVHDHYVGYLPIDTLGPCLAATYVVAVPTALVFQEADIKSALVARLPIGARVAGAIGGNKFASVAGGFIHARHLRPIAELDADPVAVAERLLGTPYLWGGRSGGGIDCSGLVQLALGLCGIAAPRDTDLQRTLGEEIPPELPLARGDLVFLPGHVGLMTDGVTLLHANAHWMAVTREPLADVLARQPAGGELLARRRLAW